MLVDREIRNKHEVVQREHNKEQPKSKFSTSTSTSTVLSTRKMTRSLSESKHADFNAMCNITESPYQGNYSAEIGEYLFEYTLSLIDPDEGLSSVVRVADIEPSLEAVEVFGQDRAKIITETAQWISASGMLYGCGWTEGIIRGSSCGFLGRGLLLICLQDCRVSRGDIQIVKAIVRDLDVWKICRDAMARWKLESTYPCLARCKEFTCKQSQLRLFRCMLFIARAAISMKILQWDFLGISKDKSLSIKIHSCFAILEKIVNEASTSKKTKSKRVVANKLTRLVLDNSTLRSCSSNSNSGSAGRSNMPVMVETRGTVLLPSASTHEQRTSQSSPPPTLNNHNKYPRGNLSLQKNPNTRDKRPNNAIAIAIAPKKHTSDLYRRLRSKDLRIVSISIHKDTRKISKSSESISISIRGDEGSSKKRRMANTTERLASITSDEHSRSDAIEELDLLNDTQPCSGLATTKVPKFSHALLDLENKKSQKRSKCDGGNFVNASLCYVSDSMSTTSICTDPNDPHYWYPVDTKEIILNHLEIETAWLVEESMYCSRSATVDWAFVMKYASPALKVALRRQTTGNDDDETLRTLLHSEIAAKRFDVFRRIVRRKLVKNVCRQRMLDVVPRLRKATHPLRLKKLAAARRPAHSVLI